MKFDVCIKSGTCNYSDYDDCDMLLQTITSEQLPNKGDEISLYTGEDGYIEYLVTNVHRSFENNEEYNTVYVIKM
jgi:hypothetical protein